MKVVTEHRKVSVPPTFSQVNEASNAGPFDPQAVQYKVRTGALNLIERLSTQEGQSCNTCKAYVIDEVHDENEVVAGCQL